MPNHFHGIVVLNPSATKPDFPVGAVIRAFKSMSAIAVNRITDRSSRLWQRNYYERIIRGDKELASIREYIQYNPANWAQDEEHPDYV